jgi:hypothetical protein
VFFGLHQKHPASGWLEGITVERFGVSKGDFGIEDISEEILNCLPFITPGCLSLVLYFSFSRKQCINIYMRVYMNENMKKQ